MPEELLSPLGSASSSSSKSGSSKSSTSSSSGSSGSSSESGESAEKSPVLQKGVLKAAKTEALEKGKEKARPHFLVETHGRPPSKLPTGQTRQEKFTGSAHRVRSIEILKSFFNNEYGYPLGTFVHHYKNCCGQLNAATAAEGIRVHYVQSAVHGGSPCVPGDRRSCCALLILLRTSPQHVSRRRWSIFRRCTQLPGHRAPQRVFSVALAIASVVARRPGNSRRRTQSGNPGVSRWQAFVHEKLGESSALEAGLEGCGRRCRTYQASTSRM